MPRRIIGELIVPLLGLAFATFLMHEQATGRFSGQTVRYTLALGVPTIILIGLVVWQVIRGNIADGTVEETPLPFFEWHDLQVFLFLFMTCAMVLALEQLGYVLAFSTYILLTALLLGIRSPLTLGLATVCSTLFVYLVFVIWLGLRLPAGLLDHWL